MTIEILVACSLLVSLSACSTKVFKREKFEPSMPTAKPVVKKPTGAIYNTHTSVLLYEDRKARHVGDILTVVLNEKTNASKKVTLNTSKDSSIGTGVTSLFGVTGTRGARNYLNNTLNGTNEFKSKGDSTQSNNISGTIAVTVEKVLANGNLLVRGQKRMLINSGEERIQLSGIVRPSDVSADNTVSSTKIANAKIIYTGKGAVASSSKMGWLARFFNSKLWPL